jgi:hypothetical protein
MIFLKKHKLLFIHIPKTGGYSVRRYYNFIVPRKVYKQRNHKFFVNNQHATSKEIKQFHPKEWNSYFKVCVVRNPWARFVSFYHHFINRKDRVKSHFDFEFFIKNYFSDPKKIFHGPLFTSSVNFIKPCSTWIANDVDMIMKLETIGNDIKTLNRKLKLSNKPMLHINKTKHKPYSHYYTDETRELIAENYKVDIERFSYEF